MEYDGIILFLPGPVIPCLEAKPSRLTTPATLGENSGSHGLVTDDPIKRFSEKSYDDF